MYPILKHTHAYVSLQMFTFFNKTLSGDFTGQLSLVYTNRNVTPGATSYT